jgi:hypothetical protein
MRGGKANRLSQKAVVSESITGRNNVNRSTRRLGVVILSVFGLTLGATAAAMAYEPSNAYVCATQGTGPCIQNNQPAIHAAVHDALTNDDRVTAESTGSNICNQDTVTSNCPFDVGSGWNSAFQGDKIRCLDFQSGGGFIGTNGYGPDAAYWRDHCGGVGTYWVVEPTGFVNIHNSDQCYEASHSCTKARWLTSQGAGNALSVVPWTQNASQWGPIS